MSSEKQNAEFRLFRLIKELDRSQFQVADNYLSSLNSTSSNFWKLYQLVLKSKTIEDFQKEVASKKSLKNSTRYLSEKVVEALASQNTAEATAIAFIDQAIEKGIFSLAKSKIKSQITSDIFFSSPVFRKKIWGRVTLLEKSFGIKIAGLLPKSDYVRVLKENKLLADAEYLAELFRSSLSLGTEKRLEIYSEFDLEGLFNSVNLLPETTIRIHIAKRNYHLLGFNREEAFKHQREIFQLSTTFSYLLPETLRIKEHFRLVSMFMAFEMYDDAQYHLMELGGLETAHESLERLQIENWIKYSLFYCACSGNVQLGKRVIRDFNRNADLFEGKWKPLLYLAILVIEIHQGNLDEIILWSNRLQRLKSPKSRSLSWVPSTAKFIAYFEKGDIKNSREQLEDIHEFNRKDSNPYLSFLENTFSTLLEFENQMIPPKQFWDIEISYQNCIQGPEAQRVANYFNIKFWIEAKKDEVQPESWIELSSQEGIFSFSAVS